MGKYVKAVPVYFSVELEGGKTIQRLSGFKVGKCRKTPLPIIRRALEDLGLANRKLLTLSDVSLVGNRVAEIMTGK